MTAAKMGRPRLPPEALRAKPLRIRLTKAEREEIDRAANGQSSTWAREILLQAARRVEKGDI